MKKVLSFFIAGMMLGILLFSCNADPDSKIAEVTDFYTSYMESRYSPTLDYIDYLYDVSEEERQLMELSMNDQLLDYEIRKVRQINENLYEVICFVKSSYIPNYFQECYNFVGIIDDRMYCFLNPYKVPTEIRENLNFEDYSYGENVMFED